MHQTVTIAELVPGMFVENIKCSESNSNFSILPGMVMSNKDIAQFRQCGIKELIINTEKSSVDVFKGPRVQIASSTAQQYDFVTEFTLGSLLKLTNQKLAVVAKASKDSSEAIELLVFYDMVTKTNIPLERIEVREEDGLIDCLINPADFDEELDQFLKLVAL